MRKEIDLDIALTPTQIRELDEIGADKESNKLTFEIAMQYHTNNCTRIHKIEKEWWEGVAELNKWNLQEGVYTVKKAGPIVKFMKVEDDD